MSVVGVVIFLALVGAFVCARARVPAGAVIFSLVALALFVATPVGQGFPDAVTTFFSALERVAAAVLNEGPTGSSG